MKSKILITTLIILLSSCSNYDVETENSKIIEYKYGYNKDQYIFQEKKIKSGDTFGDILEDVGVDYPEIFEALQTTKGNVDFKKLQIGKPYTLIFSKDSLKTLKAFVYHPTVEGYSFIQLKDSVFGKTIVKPKTYKEREASGVIDNSLYVTLDEQNMNPLLTYYFQHGD